MKLNSSVKNTGGITIVTTLTELLTVRLLNIYPSNSQACVTDADRKNTQQIVIARKRVNMWTILLNVKATGVCFHFCLLFPPSKRMGINNAPHRKPHTIKVQLAPCHNPQSVNTISVFNMVRNVPRRLPPKGM